MAYDKALCDVADCGTTVYALGLCTRHYTRLRRIGSTDLPVRPARVCEVKGCDGTYVARGLCRMHWDRARRAGEIVARGPRRPGEVTYRTVHHRLLMDRGRATQYPCFECLRPARYWAYDNEDPNELLWAEKNCAYSLDPDHYVPMCGPCHGAFDAAHARNRGGVDVR